MKPTEASGSSTLAPLGPAHTTVPTTSSPSASAGAAAADTRCCCRRGTGCRTQGAGCTAWASELACMIWSFRCCQLVAWKRVGQHCSMMG